VHDARDPRTTILLCVDDAGLRADASSVKGKTRINFIDNIRRAF
jgi:hypothetical protein